jgi:tetratricopeptide (TPR) repeat protein
MALDIRRKVFGEEHPDVASSYNNIGGVYDSKGEYALALEYYQKALDILTKVYGAEHPETRLVTEEVSFLKYRIALESGDMGGFLTEHVFTATVVDGDTPARQRGMEGEYNLLEFSDWNQDSNTSLFDKNEELRGKPKDIVVMKDGVISRHHFENTIGVQFGIKPISKEERKKIDEAYKKWKEEQRKKE